MGLTVFQHFKGRPLSSKQCLPWGRCWLYSQRVPLQLHSSFCNLAQNPWLAISYNLLCNTVIIDHLSWILPIFENIEVLLCRKILVSDWDLLFLKSFDLFHNFCLIFLSFLIIYSWFIVSAIGVDFKVRTESESQRICFLELYFRILKEDHQLVTNIFHEASFSFIVSIDGSISLSSSKAPFIISHRNHALL